MLKKFTPLLIKMPYALTKLLSSMLRHS